MIYLFLLLPPLLYAVTNLIDKKLTVGEDDDSLPSSLMLIGGLFNLLVSISILFFLLFKGSFEFSLGLFLNGSLFTLAIWSYLKVLKDSDTDRVIIWYQTIPIFGLIGGMLFLGEHLNFITISSILLIMFGSITMSLEKGKVNKKMILMMLMSSLLIASNDVVFAFFGREIGVMSAIFSDLIGKTFWSLVFLFNSKAFKGFAVGLKTKFLLHSFNEILYIIADAMFDVAKIFAPVAIVQALVSTQPIFVFLGALILAIFYPKILGEVFEKKYLKTKIIGLILVTVGSIILALEFF